MGSGKFRSGGAENYTYYRSFKGNFAIIILILSFGYIPILAFFLSGAGKLKFLCGAYDNKLIKSTCFIQDYGKFPIYDRKYDQQLTKWVTTTIDYKYQLTLRLVTQEIVEYDQNITIYFKNQDEPNKIIRENQLWIQDDNGKPCRILNWLTSQNGTWSFKNSFIQENNDLLFKDGWDDHKFTFEQNPFCYYQHVIWVSVIANHILLAAIISLIFTSFLIRHQKRYQKTLNTIEEKRCQKTLNMIEMGQIVTTSQPPPKISKSPRTKRKASQKPQRSFN